MPRPLLASGAFLAAAAALALSGCGSSNNSPSATATPVPVPPTSAAANSGSSFCTQSAAIVAQLSHISEGLASTTPGATPNVTSFKQLFATADSAIDSLDSSAPSEIAQSFHTLRAAYDQASSQVQSATTFQQLTPALSGLSSDSVSTADSQITTYLQTSCGINTSASP